MKLCECGCGAPAPIATQTDNKRGVVKGQPRRFISGHNQAAVPPPPPLERYYTVTVEGGCWLWEASLDSGGYGNVSRRGCSRMAHRAVYEGLRGPIPPGVEAHHTCGTKRCVNPDHLKLVTRSEHSQLRSKLTAEDVLAIRESLMSASELAQQYGVRVTTISEVQTGKTWRNVGGAIRAAKRFVHLNPRANRPMLQSFRADLDAARRGGV